MTDAGGFASGADNVSTLSQLAPGGNGNAGINTEEETEPGKTKIKYGGKGYAWTEEEDDALLKGAGKYGMDFKRIKKEDDGKVLADRTPEALKQRLHNHFPAKYEELRAANPRKSNNQYVPWTSEDDATLRRGVEVHGRDWEKIISDNDVLKRRSVIAIKKRYNTHL